MYVLYNGISNRKHQQAATTMFVLLGKVSVQLLMLL